MTDAGQAILMFFVGYTVVCALVLWIASKILPQNQGTEILSVMARRMAGDRVKKEVSANRARKAQGGNKGAVGMVTGMPSAPMPQKMVTEAQGNPMYGVMKTNRMS